MLSEQGILMANIINVDENNFEKEVLSSIIPVLVDFGSTWCGPCARQLLILEEFAINNIDIIKIVQLNIDKSPSITAKYNIKCIPSIVLFLNGKKIDMLSGLSTPDKLESFIQQYKENI